MLHCKITRIFTGICLIICSLVAFSSPAQAVALIRDTEIETVLRDFVTPIARSAGLNTDEIQVYIVNSPEINAFVSGGKNIYIHTGLIMEAEDPEVLLGVIAHEMGHISAGHLDKTGEAAREASIKSAASMVLAGIAAAAGAGGDAAAAIATVGTQAAQQGFFAFSRTQEQIADQIGARYLEANDIPTSGLIELLETLRTEERLHANEYSPYLRTHPLNSDRIARLRQYNAEEAAAPEHNATVEALRAPYERIRAKFYGFLMKPAQTFQRYPEDDTSSTALYARAIAYYLISEKNKSQELLDNLQEREPDNAYIKEMKAQLLFEYGDIDSAIALYESTLESLPDAPLVHLSLAQALLSRHRDNDPEQAITQLEYVTKKEPDNVSAWHALSGAYRKIGNEDMSMLALAEYYFRLGRFDEALSTLSNALLGAKQETPTWYHMKDLQIQVRQARKEQG